MVYFSTFSFSQTLLFLNLRRYAGAVNSPGVPMMTRVRETYARGGVKAFYPGGTAIAFRQATNW
jgi:hypothetical protein